MHLLMHLMHTLVTSSMSLMQSLGCVGACETCLGPRFRASLDAIPRGGKPGLALGLANVLTSVFNFDGERLSPDEIGPEDLIVSYL